MKENLYKILLSPLFLLGLFLLLLNDFVLKSEFHNFFTGKISDFAGLFVFPLFVVAFFPTRKTFIYCLTGILFVFWKSPFSQISIDFLNSFQVFNLGRTIDYTDLLALSVLPVSYIYFQTKSQITTKLSINFVKRCFGSFMIILSVFAFTATTLVEDRTVSIDGEYKFKLSKNEIENILKQNGKIVRLRIRREADVFPGMGNNDPDVITDPNGFYADFSLKQQICDSKFPEFSFHIQQEKEFSTIKPYFVHFKCKEESMKPNANSATKRYEQELTEIFEREVIKTLKQNNSQ